MVVIVDYGLGNLGSVLNMVKKLGFEAIISSNLDDIKAANKLILAGVGSFDAGIDQLNKRQLIEILNQKVLNEKTPILGICLGMQIMTNRSDEGIRNGLGWVNAETLKFSKDDLIIPHMGWNSVSYIKKSNFMDDLESCQRFYFVHSYFVRCSDVDDVLCETNYGHVFHSAFEKGNILGVQFHPEKSHKFGIEIFRKFLTR